MSSPTTTVGVADLLIATSGAGSFETSTVTWDSLLLGLLSSGVLTVALLSTDGTPPARAVVCTVIGEAWSSFWRTPGEGRKSAGPARGRRAQRFPASTESGGSPAGTVSLTLMVLSVGSAPALLTSRV